MGIVLAIDAGTSSVRVLAFSDQGHLRAIAQRPLKSTFGPGGSVSQSPTEIIDQVISCLVEITSTTSDEILGVGITNQRETFCLVDPHTKRPTTSLISWQDRTSSKRCGKLNDLGVGPRVTELTGLMIDPYFSATKVADLLESPTTLNHVGKPGFATVDTLIILALTDGQHYVTDPSNASRTLLFDTQTMAFSAELCETFEIKNLLFPDLLPSLSSGIPITSPLVPKLNGVKIHAILGDQQASLLGQGCVRAHRAKNTYGTGAFLLANLGAERMVPPHGLFCSVGWTSEEGEATYVLEGAIYTSGSLLSWLKDQVGLIQSYDEISELLAAASGSNEISVIPTFEGAGSPYLDSNLQAAIMGISASTSRSDLVASAVTAMAHQSTDVIAAMSAATSSPLESLRVDGGASVIDELCQVQADLSRLEVIRSTISESTAFGAAMGALWGAGHLSSLDEIATMNPPAAHFTPTPSVAGPRAMRDQWHRSFQQLTEFHASTLS